MRLILLLLLSVSCCAQGPMLPFPFVPQSQTFITLDATCSSTGTATVTPNPCSAPMTVTAGDTITCEGSTIGFDPLSLYFGDPINGMYDNIQALIHPNAADTWVATAVFSNAAGGTYTPSVYTYEGANTNIQCQAWKGTRTTQVVDSNGALQVTSQAVAAANPTSGTATAPTNANEAVIGVMARPTASATSSGGGAWSPAGTLTCVTSSYSQCFEYQIQTTATAVNAPFTSASTKWTDAQIPILNTSNPAGYRTLTGLFGVPAIAKTNGATATAADISGATTTLRSLNTNGNCTLTGTAATYDTSINPTGTGKIMVNGTTHTYGDAGTSLHFAQAATAVNYTCPTRDQIWGNPLWWSAFIRVSSAGTSNGGFCDIARIDGGSLDTQMWLQAQFSTGGQLAFILEPAESGSSAVVSGLATDTDYWIQEHLGGVEERFHQLLIYTKTASVWNLTNTLNYDSLCTSGANALCATAPTVATTTGTASSGSTALTVASGTGIVQGQIITGTNIPYPTTVEAVTGTAVTLSQKTTGALSTTAVNFYATLTNLVTATNGSASAASTALIVVVPSYGTIAVGNSVAGTGIAQGTFVSAVAGTAVTLSQPTNAASSSTGVTFWTNGTNLIADNFGKWSSCANIGSVWMSGQVFDPLGTWGAFAPN